MVDITSQYSNFFLRTGQLYSQAVHETHSLASEVTLVHVSLLSPSTPSLVVKREQCTARPVIASPFNLVFKGLQLPQPKAGTHT